MRITESHPPINTKNIEMTVGFDALQNPTDNENLAEKLRLAQIQIGENETIKEQCLSQLREWISQNTDIEYIPTDDTFLLMFLRAKKYSLFLAQQMILKYMNIRKKFHHLIPQLDYQKPALEELLDNGLIFASPFRDSEGRRVTIFNIGSFDFHKFTNVDFSTLITIYADTVMDDEETQLLGVNHVLNLSGMTAAFSTMFTITEFSRLVTWGEQSYPMRHKQINLLNLPTALKYIYDYAKSLMSEKLKERFIVHSSMSSLQETVSKKCLPKELGGIIPMAEMIALWREELNRKRDRVLSIEKISLLSDRGIISRKNIAQYMKDADSHGLCGSFRKLEVD